MSGVYPEHNKLRYKYCTFSDHIKIVIGALV